MSLAFKLFNFLHGSWRINRKIAGAGFLNGYAQFVKNPKNPNELFYEENGIFFFEDGKSLEASKKYIYTFLNDDIYVYFNDKSDGDVENNVSKRRLFHTFGSSNKKPSKQDETRVCVIEALHLCGEDKYQVKYEFNLDKMSNEFLIVYDVKGPKKNYVSQTTFKKVI